MTPRLPDKHLPRWSEWAAWLLPTALAAGLLLGPGIGLLEAQRSLRIEKSELQRNVYREDWLDSTQTALTAGIEADREALRLLRSRLSPFPDADAALDSLRSAAQGAGLEVLRALSKSESPSIHLRRDDLRLEGRATFQDLFTAWRQLAAGHPYAYPTEVLVRVTEDGAGKLDFQWSLALYRPQDAAMPEAAR